MVKAIWWPARSPCRAIGDAHATVAPATALASALIPTGAWRSIGALQAALTLTRDASWEPSLRWCFTRWKPQTLNHACSGGTQSGCLPLIL